MELQRGNSNSDETTTLATDSISREAFDQNQGVRGSSEELESEKTLSMPLPVEDDMEEEEVSKPKKRRTTEGKDEIFFRIYKLTEVVDQYLLELHEVRTGRVERSHLFAEENNGKWKVEVSDLAPNTYVVPPVLQEPFILRSPPKHNLSLQDRLRGWTVEQRKRGNGKEDKFYYHGGRQFRSFVEVVTFILFSTKSKEELKTVIRNPDIVGEASI